MRSKPFLMIVAVAAVSSLAQADDAKEQLQTLSNAKVSLTEAIQKAETEGMGKAVDVEVETDDTPHYAVEVLSADGKTVTEYEVDAQTGNITSARKERFERIFARLKPQDIARAQTSITEAITSVEQQTGGKVVEAETERADARLRYEITVAKADGSTEEVRIDGTSGKVASK